MHLPPVARVLNLVPRTGCLVVWIDLAHFMDMDDAPVINEDHDGSLSRHPVSVPDLVLNAAQYTAEVPARPASGIQSCND